MADGRASMRKCAVAVLISAATLHAQPVSVSELARIAAQSSKQTDAETARQLSGLELTERLSAFEFARIRAYLPGESSKQVLSVLADNSGFLPPPAEQIPADATPPSTDQRRIASLLVDYVVKAMHKVPNFFATRITTRLEDWPLGFQSGQVVPARYIPPHAVATTKSIVRYRDGVEQAEPMRTKKKQQTEYGLTAWGAFGPVLRTVLADSAQSMMAWSRWEQIEGTRVAVFRYSVPYEKSTYDVRFCCVPIENNMLSLFERRTAYHGEIAVDPDTGTVLRLTLQAELDRGDLGTLFDEAVQGSPLVRADFSVEYGPVEIGGKMYYCPIRAVAISRARTLVHSKDSEHRFLLGPAKNYINEITYSDYHIFRSESRILPAAQ